MKKIAVVLIIFFSINLFAKSFGGISFENSFKYGKNKRLVLNGAGFLKKFWFKVYIVALYLPKKNKNASEIINLNKPMAMKLKIVYKVSLKKLKKGLLDGLKKSPKLFNKLQPQVKQFLSYFDKKPHKYDTATFFYMPQKGTFVSTNGKFRGLIKGFEFKKMLFNIWLGKKSPSNDLKKGILGK